MIIDTHTHLGQYDEAKVTPDLLLASMDAARVDEALVFAHEQLPSRFCRQVLSPAATSVGSTAEIGAIDAAIGGVN